MPKSHTIARLAGCAAIAAAALLAAPRASAAPIPPSLFNYVFTAGTTASVMDGTETVTGSFTYNSATNALTNVNVLLSGASAYSGVYDYQYASFTSKGSNGTGGSLGLAAAGDNNANGDLLFFALQGVLGSNTIAIGNFAAYNDPVVGNESTTIVTGGIQLASNVAVPEPASVAMLGAGLAMLGLRRKRRA